MSRSHTNHSEFAVPGTEGPRRQLPGSHDQIDQALLIVSKLVLSATIRAGAAAEPALSPTQIRTLTLMAEGPSDGLSLSAVAEHLSASTSSVSRICQRLVRDGLVARAAGPGNELRLSLSDAGVDVLATINRARIADLRRLIESLPEAKRKSAVKAFEALADRATREPSA